MNRATRDKFTSGTGAPTSPSALWQTPPAVFAKLHDEFRFDLDLCADVERALLPRWFGPGSPRAEDALAVVDWAKHGARAFGNPPYGAFIRDLLIKASAEQTNGFLSALLLPVRMTRAFHQFVLAGDARVLICDKRIAFFEDGLPRLNERQWREKGKATADPALFDSMIVVFDPTRMGRATTIEAWRVPPHVSKADLELAAEARRAKERAS
jgi:hypothetical protein